MEVSQGENARAGTNHGNRAGWWKSTLGMRETRYVKWCPSKVAQRGGTGKQPRRTALIDGALSGP
jgi:hypothetical protein